MNQFLDYLKYEKRVSEHTLKAYRYDIKEFLTFIKKIKNKTEIWIQYSIFLAEKEFQKKTQERKKTVVKQYYKFLFQEDKIKSMPTMLETTRLKEKKLPKSLTHDQMKQLLSQPLKTEQKILLRDKTILELFYSCGLRVSELLNLKIIHILEDSTILKVTGKRNKTRLIPVGSVAKKYLVEYLTIDRDKWKNKTEDKGYVFINKKGEKLSRQAIYYRVQKYARSLNLKTSPHQFRHTFATHLLENGAPLIDLQMLLGHQDISTTQIYTSINTKKIKENYLKAHPRSGA